MEASFSLGKINVYILVVFLQHFTGISCIIAVVTFDTDTGQFGASVLVWNRLGIFSQAHFRQVMMCFIH